MFRCQRVLQSCVRRYSSIAELLSGRNPPLAQRTVRPPTTRILKPPSSEQDIKPIALKRPRRDEEIEARFITFVDEQGTVHSRCRLSQVLRQFDRTQYFLVEVDPSARPNPVCRLFDKKAMFEKEKTKKRNKTTAPDSVLKEVMFGWNVSAHDMEHKLNKACQFLEKGNRVKVDIVYKKGQNRVDKATQQEVIKSVTNFMDKYKLAKVPAINGQTCTMQYENK
ncbi:hypothetical protein G6F56_002618 [Rhizopus delemar]|uniref:Translation initiation factor IF-3 n=1 Tax=Rhizopus stolonifer TaxID=4846 RepID=A0A367KYT9_RHIST|nr:hypothetical protein G6F56_002618 [Rhizopus delemar]RCI07102.1 hypothetical protein CU098_013946 [Rhizopus stolonifer]